VQELRRFQPEGPYALGGYCFGGNVAYEMARQLDQQGQRVNLLVLLNSSPPNSSYDRMAWTPLYVYKFLRNLGRIHSMEFGEAAAVPALENFGRQKKGDSMAQIIAWP
jgi:thioesterase domain-containing protein